MAKVLVIDDDEGMRRNLLRILHGGGHEVVAARDGAEGLEVFHSAHPDIVVTDIVMPHKEGMETIIDLRREAPSIPILAISGGNTGSPLYLKFAEMLGAHATLAKPFRAQDLLREVDKLLVTISAPHPSGLDQGSLRLVK